MFTVCSAAGMEDKIANLGKDVLVEMVKLAQKRGIEGAQGGWKEFLTLYDRKLGANLSDPSKRSVDVLSAFLKTFTIPEHLMFFEKVIQRHSNREVVENFKNKSSDNKNPEQRLVRLTLEHPFYPLDFSFPSHEEEWTVTRLPRKSKSMRSTNMVAVDCEMVRCEDGTEALVRVCVVDRDLKVKLNELVNPCKPVADYRSAITGITAEDLSEVTCTLADIQKSMRRLLSHGTILIGHSLNNDMQALKLDHSRVIDTALIFGYTNQQAHRRPSLNNLCKSVLGQEVRLASAPHNCMDDACAAMKLVISKIENGVDTPIEMVHEDVPKVEMEKLLLHHIPISVPPQELQNIFSHDYEIEQATKKSGGKFYSVKAIFETSEDADLAFEKVIGEYKEDSFGRPQKLISFKPSTGETVSLSVRKMENSDEQNKVIGVSKKRPLQDEEMAGEPNKKLKKDEIITSREQVVEAAVSACCDHLKEIEKLKELISERDIELKHLHEMFAKLTRNQGKGKRVKT